MSKQKSRKGEHASLENDLRNMILGNVTLAGASHAQSQQSPQRDNNSNSPYHGRNNSQYRNPRQSQHGQGQSIGRQAHIVPGTPEKGLQQPALNSPGERLRPMGTGRGSGRGGQNLPIRQQAPRGNGPHPQNDRSQYTGPRTLYQPPQQGPAPIPYEMWVAQCQHLEQLASIHIPESQMTPEEMAMKDAFRVRLESVCQTALSEYDTTGLLQLQLKAFGSFRSGFATKGSDMDLSIAMATTGQHSRAVIVEPPLLRAIEKSLLSCGLGARLLTRTRVPIIKICESPTEELLTALLAERQRWEELPDDEKYVVDLPAPPSKGQQTVKQSNNSRVKAADSDDSKNPTTAADASAPATPIKSGKCERPGVTTSPATVTSKGVPDSDRSATDTANKPQNRRPEKPWLREKKLGPLDFPKSGVGVQCDINFSNDLALHNTHLLRCYCLCDVRVQPIVLFIKAWAKRRKINSSYSGTLSSYGYVLMILHYLANVANPPVIPNLQLSWRPPMEGSWRASLSEERYVSNYDIRFWNNEEEIKQLAAEGKLTMNKEPIGALLRNFFLYYANTGVSFGIGRGFQWTQDVLSLRTAGGLVKKAAKGWTGAKTTIVGQHEVRNRYLFAIEDPFEIDHNVARTVTHQGIIAIRDEFRRAWRILNDAASGPAQGLKKEELFDEVKEDPPAPVDASEDRTTANQEEPSANEPTTTKT